MKSTENINIEDYPLMLTVKEVSQILRVSKRIGYEVMGRKDFPLTNVGRHKKVYRDSFFEWMNSESNVEFNLTSASESKKTSNLEMDIRELCKSIGEALIKFGNKN